MPLCLRTNQDHDSWVASATDEEWQIVNLTDDTDANLAKLYALNENNPRVRIVMQADWNCKQTVRFGVSVNIHTNSDLYWIWDLNGHKFTIDAELVWGRIAFRCNVDKFEITDSVGTGQFNTNGQISVYMYAGTELVISGGNINFYPNAKNKGYSIAMSVEVWSHKSSTRRLTITGGQINAHSIIFNFDDSYDVSRYPDGDAYLVVQRGTICVDEVTYFEGTVPHETFADNIQVVHDTAGNIIGLTDDSAVAYVIASDPNYRQYLYAVSTVPFLSGAYNSAYGVAWDITAAQLADLPLVDGRKYYLFRRPSADSAVWYTATGLTL